MKTLSVDLETYSSVDLAKCGVYKYASSPDFEILLFGYSIDGGEVRVVDLACGETVPEEILSALTDDSVLKWAYNAQFERICISSWLRREHPQYFSSYGIPEDTTGDYLDPASWRCSRVWGAYMGLPLSLDGIGKVLNLPEQKMKEGKALIRYFCQPCKPTKANGGRTRNLPGHAPDKWTTFKAYNKRDVETELAVQEKLQNFPMPDFLWEEYRLDQEINDRGIRIDRTLVDNAIRIDRLSKEELTSVMKEITGLENPNSVTQLRGWLKENGVETGSLDKKTVAELVETAAGPLRTVLLLRQQLSKSSVKKYTAMQNAACSDDRVRGMFLFLGASRTGRFSSKIIQLQNLPQNHLEHLDDARNLVRSGDYEMLGALYDDVPDTLSQLVRTAFIPREGCKFIVTDFSSIEARVLSYLAGEEWRIKVFDEGGDIYCASASQMFGVPVEKHGVNSHLRQKGKVAELACIAEGQLVLTDQGLIPIEKVTTDDLVWDGESWVEHEGVVYKGVRDVITYEGLTATPDHLVWFEDGASPEQFGVIASCSAHLLQTGSYVPVAQNDLELRKARVYDIKNAGRHHRFTVSGRLVHNCGYGGSVGALKAMGAAEMGLSDEEMKQTVNDWRTANPNIVQFWWDVDRAVKTTIKNHTDTKTHGLTFQYRSGMLFILLPSGRRLAYAKPRIMTNRFGGESVSYEGVGNTKKWERIESYGAKYVENCTQAISRDILAYAMKTLSHCFITAHVHDELIIECGMDVSVEAICEQMGRTPPWIPGLNLRADGYETMYYRKD